MPQDDTSIPSASSAKAQAAPASKSAFDNLFKIPAPLRVLFDHFPLITYPANELPRRAPREHLTEHVLHVFTTPEAARRNAPSFNPSCLRWQTYLHLTKLPFTIVSSTNHASPSGALPFLQPISPSTTTLDPIPSTKLRKWLRTQPTLTIPTEPTDPRYEACLSLLETRIRKAWLYQLYLHPANTTLLTTLYASPASSNPLVQHELLSQLRAAAELEIVKASDARTVSAVDILREAGEAWVALGELLAETSEKKNAGQVGWFFGAEEPGEFDAALFAYTHLVLGGEGKVGGVEWAWNGLGEVLEKEAGLVAHRRRIVELYY